MRRASTHIAPAEGNGPRRDQPSLPSRNFFANSTGVFSVPENGTLWNVGNGYALKAEAMAFNLMRLYGPGTNNSANFINDTDKAYIVRAHVRGSWCLSYLWCAHASRHHTPSRMPRVQLYNGPRCLVSAYEATLDGLMQSSIDDSDKVNQVQLVVLAVEGAFVGLLAFFIMWHITSTVREGA